MGSGTTTPLINDVEWPKNGHQRHYTPWPLVTHTLQTPYTIGWSRTLCVVRRWLFLGWSSEFLASWKKNPKKWGRTNSAEEDDGGCRGIYASLSLVSHTHKWLNYYKWGQPILEYLNGMFLPFFYIFTSTLWLKNVKFNYESTLTLTLKLRAKLVIILLLGRKVWLFDSPICNPTIQNKK